VYHLDTDDAGNWAFKQGPLELGEWRRLMQLEQRATVAEEHAADAGAGASEAPGSGLASEAVAVEHTRNRRRSEVLPSMVELGNGQQYFNFNQRRVQSEQDSATQTSSSLMLK
jgi:hypothetical protein